MSLPLPISINTWDPVKQIYKNAFWNSYLLANQTETTSIFSNGIGNLFLKSSKNLNTNKIDFIMSFGRSISQSNIISSGSCALDEMFMVFFSNDGNFDIKIYNTKNKTFTQYFNITFTGQFPFYLDIIGTDNNMNLVIKDSNKTVVWKSDIYIDYPYYFKGPLNTTKPIITQPDGWKYIVNNSSTDMIGNDFNLKIKAINLDTNVISGSSQICKDTCAAAAGCSGFVLKDNKCDLKNTNPARTYSIFDRTDYTSKDISVQPGTPDTCKLRCDSMDDCSGFVLKGDGNCYFKDSTVLRNTPVYSPGSKYYYNNASGLIGPAMREYKKYDKTDYPGYDIKNYDATDLNICKKDCDSLRNADGTSSCKGITFNGSHCYLKDNTIQVPGYNKDWDFYYTGIAPPPVPAITIANNTPQNVYYQCIKNNTRMDAYNDNGKNGGMYGESFNGATTKCNQWIGACEGVCKAMPVDNSLASVVMLKNNGLCLDKNAPGNNPYIGNCSKGNMNQYWKINSAGQIVNMLNGQCLDGNNIGQIYMNNCFEDVSTPNKHQQWVYSPGDSSIRNMINTSKCLNNNLNFSDCNSSDNNQKWTLQSTDIGKILGFNGMHISGNVQG
jgi:hypothetical protein